MTRCRLFILCMFFAAVNSAQRTYEKNGKTFYQLKGGLVRDDKGNVYSVFTCEDGPYLTCFSDKMPFRDWEKYEAIKDVVDTASYVDFVNSPFSKDRDHAYYTRSYADGHYMRIIDGADPSTFYFHKNSEYEAEDKFAYYYYKNYSLETLRKDMKYKNAGKGFYLGENGKMYIKTEVLEDLHKDKWSKSFYREVPGVDVQTYTDWGSVEGYAKDKDHVYWRKGTTDGLFFWVVEGADPATFKPDPASYTDGKDRSGGYHNGSKIKNK